MQRNGKADTTNGALRVYSAGGGLNPEHNSSGTAFEFNASWNNNIYGNSNTVQPSALISQYLIKY